MATKRESDAWLKMLEFIKTNDDGVFEFIHPGNKQEAKDFVHRMRVELSRARKMAKRRNKTLKIFKMNIIDIEEFLDDVEVIDEQTGEEVTRKMKKSNVKLHKAIPGSGDIQNEIQDFFKDITVEGEQVNG